MANKLPVYYNFKMLAIIGAIILHFGLAAWAIHPSVPVTIENQVLQVSFVAPSSVQEVEKQVETAQIESSPVTPPKKDGVKKAKPKNKKHKTLQNKSNEKKKNNNERQTSGPESENATEIESAEVAPSFNAAYLNNPAPTYPPIARRRGFQGIVYLEVLVKADGTPASITISDSSGSTLLDNAALDAVKEWKFIPARRGSELIQASVIVPIEFKLN